MSSKTAWHTAKSVSQKEFELSKADRIALAKKFRSSIRVGLAIVPFCEETNCWLLPEGPNQVNRHVRHYDIAFAFATKMNDILQHYPQLAVRLDQMKRREAA